MRLAVAILSMSVACLPLGAMRIDNIDTPYFPKVTFPEGLEKPVVTLHESTSYLLPGNHATHRMDSGQSVEAPLTAELFPAFSVEDWEWSGVHEDGTPASSSATRN